MPRRIPKYQQFKPRNLAKVRLDGKDVYLGEYDSPESHAKYKRVIGEWLLRHQALPEKIEEITIVELLASYLKHAGEYYVKDGKQTREFGCITEALRPLRQMYEMTLACEFGPLALKAIRAEMIVYGWSRKHVNKQIGRVVRMFRWAVGQELVSPSTHQALAAVEGLKKGRTSAPDYEPVKPVADTVVETTLGYLSRTVADMVRIQRLIGCRPGEVCLIRPCDIDRSREIWVYTPESHKTEHHGKARRVFIGPRAQKLLSRYLLRPETQYCFCPREAQGVRRNTGSRYTKDSYGRAVRRAARKAGVERWSPNRLRHAAATEIRREFGLEAAQVILGHSTANVTQIYAERDMDLAAGVARKLG